MLRTKRSKTFYDIPYECNEEGDIVIKLNFNSKDFTLEGEYLVDIDLEW